MRKEPKPLQVYKHFKGNVYQVVTVAVHTESGEKLVIYRPLYSEGTTYARPLSMFMSEVDKKKYPEVKQKFRFEEINEPGEFVDDTTVSSESSESEAKMEEGLNPLLEAFLDAPSYEEKLDKFYDMRKSITDDMLSYVAMSLDIELSKETTEDKYKEILGCLKTMVKYECNRLRS